MAMVENEHANFKGKPDLKQASGSTETVVAEKEYLELACLLAYLFTYLLAYSMVQDFL
jgi:hypothetical protein